MSASSLASFLFLPSSFAVLRKLLFDLESGSEDEQRASLSILESGSEASEDEQRASLAVLESGSEASGDEHRAPLGVFRFVASYE